MKRGDALDYIVDMLNREIKKLIPRADMEKNHGWFSEAGRMAYKKRGKLQEVRKAMLAIPRIKQMELFE